MVVSPFPFPARTVARLSPAPPPAPRALRAQPLSPPLRRTYVSTPSPRAPPPPVSRSPWAALALALAASPFSSTPGLSRRRLCSHGRQTPPTTVGFEPSDFRWNKLYSPPGGRGGRDRRRSGNSWRRSSSRLSANYSPTHDTMLPACPDFLSSSFFLVLDSSFLPSSFFLSFFLSRWLGFVNGGKGMLLEGGRAGVVWKNDEVDGSRLCYCMHKVW